MALMQLLLVVILEFRGTAGHGYLAMPPSKNAADINSYKMPFDDYWLKATWFLDKASLNGDTNQKPWSAPGQFNYVDAYNIGQQAFHPCGCYNPGNPAFCAGVKLANGFGETAPGHAVTGPFPLVVPPKWSKGSVQETAFNMYANHAGGYVYMVCDRSKFDKCRSDHLPESMETTTKEQLFAYETCVWDCFESNTLEFVNNSQTIQYGDRADLSVNAKAVSKGAWREVPLPDSSQISSGNNDHGRCTWDAIDDSSFSSNEAGEKFVASFGGKDTCDSGPHQHHPRNWHIKDMIKIPEGIPSGNYLLMWRWDCGLADQIWSNCADVQIVDGSGSTSTSAGSGTATYTSTASTDGTTPRTSVTSSTTTHVLTSTTSALLMPASSTSTSKGAQCSDLSLPGAWSGGGVHTCLTYQKQSLAHCTHPELRSACCFCGGGQFESVSTTVPPSCADAPLPTTWSSGGVHSCSTYEQHGGSTYCTHREIAEACCFCREDLELLRFSTLDLPTEYPQFSGRISRTSMFTPNVFTMASLLLGVICGPSL